MYYYYNPDTTTNRDKRIYETLKSLAFRGKLQDQDFIERQLDKGRIFRGLSEEAKAKVRELIPIWIRILNEYHGNNWTFYLDYSGDYLRTLTFDLSIQIYYPNVTIKDELDCTHEIQGLIVQIPIYCSYEYDAIIFGIIRGGRVLLTASEFVSGYNHSHLPTNNLSIDSNVSSRPFCLGRGTDIEVLRDEIERKVQSLDENSFELLLNLINGVVEHESEAGVPYIRFSSLANTTNVTNYENSLSELHSGTIPSMEREITFGADFSLAIVKIKDNIEQIGFSIQDNRISLLDSAVLRKIIKDSFRYRNIMLVNTPDKVYQLTSNSENRQNNFTQKKQALYDLNLAFIGNGFTIPFTVIESEEEETINVENSYIHPVIYKKIKEKLDIYFTNKIKDEKFTKS